MTRKERDKWLRIAEKFRHNSDAMAGIGEWSWLGVGDCPDSSAERFAWEEVSMSLEKSELAAASGICESLAYDNTDGPS